jgi:RNA polymerase sigma-70 factor (ECF subfamily)
MHGRFETTRWSVVLAAQEGSPSEARQALAELCEAYWEPLYAFARRRGHGAEEAKDLTQGFFTELLGKDYLASVRPAAGRLRSFLLVCLKHFLANEIDRARALKRGGGVAPIPLDVEGAESRYQIDPVDELTPEMVFERRWALTVIAQVMADLGQEAAAAGKQARFDRLKAFLVEGRPKTPYRRLAQELDMSEGAVKMAVHRLRQRFGEVLRGKIAEMVADDSEVDAEIRHLLLALG